jgi:hypothetical protein
MAAMSNYLETALLDFVLNAAGDESFTSPASVWVSLYTDDPGDDDSGTEVTGNDYARVQVTEGFEVTGVDTADNDAAVTFPPANGGDWGTVTHVGIHDASTAGNLLFHGILTAEKIVGDGDTFEFAIGNLDVTLA